MVESKLGFFEVEMKALAGNTSVVIEPSFGIGEETFNTVDMGSSANVFLFAVQDSMVFSSRGEYPISLKVIGVIYAAPSGMFQNDRHKSGPSSIRHREGYGFPISLIHPEDQLFPLSSPTTLSFSPSAKEGFIELKLSGESFHLGKRSVVDGFPEEPKGPVSGGEVVGKVKPCPIAWNTQAKKIEEMSNFIEGNAELPQVGAGKIGKWVAAAGTPEPLVATPKFPLSASWADPSSAPSNLDKKSPTFWQTSCQGFCLFCKHENMISQYHLCGNYLVSACKRRLVLIWWLSTALPRLSFPRLFG